MPEDVNIENGGYLLTGVVGVVIFRSKRDQHAVSNFSDAVYLFIKVS